MSSSEEQASLEFIDSLLEKHGKPDEGKIYRIRQEADSAIEIVSLSSDFYPSVTVVAFICKNGDVHCYGNTPGYPIGEVFED